MNEEDVTWKKANKRSISLVFQQPLLFPHMTVKENINYGAKLAKKFSTKKTTKLLQAIGLESYQDYFPSEISGGQQQRVALARAMATEPEVILFDEPFSSLDPQLREELRYWVRRFLVERSITSIFVTHDTEEAMLMGDRVAIFHEGHFQQINTPSFLHKKPANPFVAKFLRGHLVLNNHQYAPLPACRVTLNSKETAAVTFHASLQHVTYQHGQAIAHLLIDELNEKISLPLDEAQIFEKVLINIDHFDIQNFEDSANET